MRIGVYGGTFNPIHRGHLTAARAAADALGLEKVLLIPDSLPPHKELPAGSATGEDRLAMCRLTAGEVPGMEVLDLELRRSGPSYTSDTLAELHAQYPDDELWLLVGSDMFLSLQEWHEPERILSLAGIDSGSLWVQLLKPASFTPVLALIGIIFYMFCKDTRKKDTGLILLGFTTLMFGMETMSGAVAGLKDVPAFTNLFIAFKNPVLGVLAGAILTAVIQSSSASVGILQALAVTGSVSYAAAIPIIMGQNIGTTVTAMISSIGTNKNAKRAAVVHLLFNVIGVVVLLTVFCIVRAVFAPALLNEPATMYGIAVAHSAFNLLCTAILLPAGGLLEKLAKRIVPDDAQAQGEKTVELDERLLATPSLALSRSRAVAYEMADCAVRALNNSLTALTANTPELAQSIRDDEERCDHYEDILGTYLVKLSARKMGRSESEEATELLKTIGDFERISDHAVNILTSAEEMTRKGLTFSASAKNELATVTAAIREILSLSLKAFERHDTAIASQVEPLEQVIDTLKEQMRTRHILRMQQGQCSIEAGFVLSDLLTDLERTSDHCSNIAGCIIDASRHNLNLHETLREAKSADSGFQSAFHTYAEKYQLPLPAAEQDA